MTKFSANLGFLWADLALPDAIRAAKTAGFDAVECHWPYNFDAQLVRSTLDDMGLAMLGLNTSRGNIDAGDNGLSALPNRKPEARHAIEEAVSYASQIGAKNIHVMAGFAKGQDAHDTFVENLTYAAELAKPHGLTILIEPLNHYDAPGYFLSTTGQASKIINEVSVSNLKLMFDCYHVQLMEGNLTNLLKSLLPIVGHVQFASVPDRGTPDHGELCYPYIFEYLEKLGWQTPLGAEYKPLGNTEDSLEWLRDIAKLPNSVD